MNTIVKSFVDVHKSHPWGQLAKKSKYHIFIISVEISGTTEEFEVQKIEIDIKKRTDKFVCLS